jgi:hypothetical protein
MDCDKELLVGYLYDELTPAERESFAAHVRVCGACREEVQELQATRTQLATWAPPEPDFGFRIIRGAAAPPEPRWRSLPAWGLAAAAALVLAASAAIANLEVRYDDRGFSVSTGWSRATPALANLTPTPTSPGGAPSDQVMQLRADLVALGQRLDAVEKHGARADTLNVGNRGSEAELLRRVNALIDQGVQASEKRQRGELALRVAQLIRDFDLSRASDLARVQQAIQQTEGLTNAELLRQGRQVDFLMRVSSSQQK